jgi:hypothetical protein
MSNKASLIITIAVALLAVAAAAVAYMMITSDNPTDNSNTTGEFRPDEELGLEGENAAQRLVRDNFEVLNLFHLMEFDKFTHFEPEPYGNDPEDGFYTLKSGVLAYESLERIFNLVDGTFVRSTAEEIKTSSSQTANATPVYKDKDGRIGVNATFVPKEDYDLAWDSVPITLAFESETKAVISATLTNSNGEVIERQMNMVKDSIDGIWRLETLFF